MGAINVDRQMLGQNRTWKPKITITTAKCAIAEE